MSNLGFRIKLAGRTSFLMAVFVASAAGNVSHAVTVTNLSSGTKAFEDNFESGLSTLTPSVGQWARVGPSVGATNSATAPAPGPAEGSFYASLFRSDATTNSMGDLLGSLGTVQSVTGNLLRLSFMLYVPDDGVTDRARIFLADGDYINFRALVRTDGAGNVLSSGPGGALTDTGIDYVPDAWQRWDLTYEIGSTSFSLRVGDAFASGLGSPSGGQVSTLGISNGNPAAGAFYVDAVPIPEPATYALLATGWLVVGAAAAKRGRRAEGETP